MPKYEMVSHYRPHMKWRKSWFAYVLEGGKQMSHFFSDIAYGPYDQSTHVGCYGKTREEAEAEAEKIMQRIFADREKIAARKLAKESSYRSRSLEV